MVSPNRTHDPVLENAYIIKSLSARELSLEDSQKVTVLARRAVSRSGIGPWAKKQRRRLDLYHSFVMKPACQFNRGHSIHDVPDAPFQPVKSNYEESNESKDEDDDIEFHSDESDGSDGVKD